MFHGFALSLVLSQLQNHVCSPLALHSVKLVHRVLSQKWNAIHLVLLRLRKALILGQIESALVELLDALILNGTAKHAICCVLRLLVGLLLAEQTTTTHFGSSKETSARLLLSLVLLVVAKQTTSRWHALGLLGLVLTKEPSCRSLLGTPAKQGARGLG